MSVQEGRGESRSPPCAHGRRGGASLAARPCEALPSCSRTHASRGDAVVTLGRAQSPVRPLPQREPWMCPSRSPTCITLMKQLLALLAEVL